MEQHIRTEHPRRTKWIMPRQPLASAHVPNAVMKAETPAELAAQQRCVVLVIGSDTCQIGFASEFVVFVKFICVGLTFLVFVVVICAVTSL